MATKREPVVIDQALLAACVEDLDFDANTSDVGAALLKVAAVALSYRSECRARRGAPRAACFAPTAVVCPKAQTGVAHG